MTCKVRSPPPPTKIPHPKTPPQTPHLTPPPHTTLYPPPLKTPHPPPPPTTSSLFALRAFPLFFAGLVFVFFFFLVGSFEVRQNIEARVCRYEGCLSAFVGFFLFLTFFPSTFNFVRNSFIPQRFDFLQPLLRQPSLKSASSFVVPPCVLQGGLFLRRRHFFSSPSEQGRHSVPAPLVLPQLATI